MGAKAKYTRRDDDLMHEKRHVGFFGWRGNEEVILFLLQGNSQRWPPRGERQRRGWRERLVCYPCNHGNHIRNSAGVRSFLRRGADEARIFFTQRPPRVFFPPRFPHSLSSPLPHSSQESKVTTVVHHHYHPPYSLTISMFLTMTSPSKSWTLISPSLTSTMRTPSALAMVTRLLPTDTFSSMP